MVANPPLQELSISRFRGTEEIFAIYLPEHDFRDDVSPDLFAGLTSGMTAAQATEILGPPTAVEQTDYGEAYRYRTEIGEIVIMKVRATEGTWWDVRLYPAHLLLEDVLPRQILEVLDTTLASSRVNLRNHDRASGVAVGIKNGTLEFISPIEDHIR